MVCQLVGITRSRFFVPFRHLSKESRGPGCTGESGVNLDPPFKAGTFFGGVRREISEKYFA